MLSHCHITNLAIVKSIDLDLESHMTVITGETGAGKSILLDAIGLCFGDKAEAIFIRPGGEKAEMVCTFDIENLPQALIWLKDNEFIEQTPECLIRRIIYASGRSKAYINGSPATTQQLKCLGEHLVQIHGQHQHQLLLKPLEQLRLLDAFANHLPLLNEVQKHYKKWKQYLTEKQTLLKALSQDTNRLALLKYQVAELSDLNLQEQELERLDLEQNQLYHAQADCEEAENALSLSKEAQTLLHKTAELCKKLMTRHASLKAPYDVLRAIDIQVQEAISDLNGFYQKIDINPEQLQAVEQRLSTIYDMARKHKIRPEALMAHFETLNTELTSLSNIDERLAQLDDELAQAKLSYMTAAASLTLSRQTASAQLAKEIEAWLEPLGIPGGHFSIMLPPQEMSLNGLETAQFCVSTNPGHPLQALHKVASGGELSRISLAIQLIVAQYLNTPTLIFDEVDVGVGGKIGSIIGKALNTLGQSVQILCVTHLPQVAAFGNHHIQVVKHRNINDTYTTIEPLIPSNRVEELARMLGGIEITEQARNHARELLNL